MTNTTADRRRVPDSEALRRMLADLRFAFEYPQRVEQYLSERPTIDGLFGFAWWVRQRRCRVCKRLIPMYAEKFCGRQCFAVWHRRRKMERGASPYARFEAAVVPARRAAVPEIARQQANAERLIERGCCAYRNRRGFIGDIGVPTRPEDRGRVFGFE